MMAWATPLWSISYGGQTFQMYVDSDTYWQRESGDAELHVLHSNETTVHKVGRPSDTRTWRGLVVTKAMLKKLQDMVGYNCSFATPYDSGQCRIMSYAPRQVFDAKEPTVAKYQVTVELMYR